MSGNDAVAEQHQIHHRFGERTGYQHGTEFFLAKAFHDSASNLTVKALKRRAVSAFAAAGNCAQRRIQGVLKILHRAIYQ